MYIYKCKWVQYVQESGTPNDVVLPTSKDPKRIISGQLFENIPDTQTGAAASWKPKSTIN